MDATTKTLDPSFVTKDERIEALKAIIKAAEAEKKALEAEFKAVLGEGGVGVLPNGIEYAVEIVTRKAYTVSESIFAQLKRRVVKLMVA
jgi:hypothetical protein